MCDKDFFPSFVRGNELDKDVVVALETEKIVTMTSMMGLRETDIDALSLKRGDASALRRAVGLLQAENGGGPMSVTSPVVPQGVSAERSPSMLMHDLLGTPSVLQDTEHKVSERVDLDPQVYLSTKRPQGEKAHIIVDFLPATENVEEVALIPGTSLYLKTGTKTKLREVSPAQWMSANARIMARLLDEGRLNGTGIKDYLSYTAKVGELACRFTWTSVLVYDNEYRQQQAAASFRWGSDSQHLSTTLLKEKPVTVATKTSRHTDNRDKKKGPGGKDICLQYNNGKCSFGARCNYEHVCLVCSKPHAQVNHQAEPGHKD